MRSSPKRSPALSGHKATDMRQFLSYIHFLRGVAILYVVSVHARGFESYWHSSPETYSFLDTFSDPSEGNGTTMFLFIGGFLFQHLNRHRFHFGKYMTQKFKNLIMPYLIISIPILIWRFHTNFAALFVPEDFHDRSAFMQVLHFMFTGSHLPPFWFISTIILFYFAAQRLWKWHPLKAAAVIAVPLMIEVTYGIANLLKLASAIDPDGPEEKRRPPRVSVKWGVLPEFQGVIESIGTKYTMFVVTQ